MKVIDPGHEYELGSLDGELKQTLLFVKREGAHYPGNVGSHPGTTMQEVLRALIHRAEYVNAQIPCRETSIAIDMMRGAIHVMELRAKRVKGKTLYADIENIEKLPTCSRCGHVMCTEDHGT